MGIDKGKLLNVVLAFLVILSFVLSYSLWTAGRNIGAEETTTGQTARSNVSITTHHASDTFRPTNIALHGVDDQHQIVMGKSYPLRHLLRDIFEERNLTRINRSTLSNYAEYMGQLQAGRWIEFIYNEELPIGLLEQKFVELSRENGNEFFNRVLINLDDQDRVIFYHTDTETVYIAETSEGEELNIDPFLNEENMTYTGVFPVLLSNNIVYLPQEPTSVPYKSYVIDQLPNSAYIGNFFPDTSLVDRRSNAGITRFIDLTKEVSINQNIYTLNYLRQISDPGELEPVIRFTRSFDQVNRFENWSDTYVLSEYDRQRQVISFQREIEGYPVFSPHGYETITEVGLVESGVTHMKLPLRFINTPVSITMDGAPSRVMISGQEVMAELNAAVTSREFERIEDITIGYSWDESEESNQFIYFNPEWFILFDGNWMTLDAFLALSKEVANFGL